MADYLKKPLARSINEAGAKRAADAIQRTGKSLPCTVARVISSGIVVVNFEVNAAPFTLPQITVPVVGSEYVRLPIQAGDKGRVTASDARLGGISGLGAGVPDLMQPGNLSALAFEWLGNTDWSATEDPNALVMYGPNGCVIRTADSANKVVVNSSGVQITGELAFFGGTPAAKQTIIGALSAVTDANAKAVLTSIIAGLVAYNEMTNGTT